MPYILSLDAIIIKLDYVLPVSVIYINPVAGTNNVTYKVRNIKRVTHFFS